MQLVWVAIVQFLTIVVWPLVLKVLKAAGVGFIAYQGATVAMSQGEDYLFSYYNSFPTDVYQLLTMAGFDQGVKMIFAAAVARIATQAASGKWTGPWNKDTVTNTGGAGGTLGA